MTTNSPNPVDGDVQALIEYCQRVLHGSNNGSQMEQVYKIALAALTAEPEYHTMVGHYYTAPPAQLLRPVEFPDEAPNALIALCQQVYDSRITGSSVAQDVWQDCLDELRQQGYEVKS